MLSSGKIVVYYGSYDELISEPALILLSEDEKLRVDKVKLESDRRLFVQSRAVLRYLLSKHLDVPAKDIPFEYKINGKPYLKDYPVHFNVAHSKGNFLIAIALDSEIGVDYEHFDRDVDIYKMAGFLFSKYELEEFKNQKVYSQKTTFIQTWTKKEAVLKAIGIGFRLSPDQMEICTDQELVKFVSCSLFDRKWFVKGFDLPNNCYGALAFDISVRSIELVELSDEQLKKMLQYHQELSEIETSEWNQ